MKKFYNVLSIIFYSELILGLGIFLYAQFSLSTPIIHNPNYGSLVVTGNTILHMSIFFLLCTIGLAVLLYFFIAERKNISLLNLSFFIFISAFWSLFASRIPTVLFKNYLLFNLLLNASFSLLSIPFILYIVELCKYGKKMLLILCSVILFGNAVSLIWLMTHNFTFPKILSALHILLIITIISFLYVVIKDFIKRRNQNNKMLVVGLSIFVVASLINIIGYYTNPAKSYSDYMTMGLLLFIAILVIVTFKNIVTEILIVRNFEKIATDIPSGVFKAKVDENMTLIYANKFYYNLFGYTGDKMAEGFTSACVPFINREKLLSECRGQIEMGNVDFELEALARNSDGEIIDLLLSLHHNRESNEIVGNVYDITSRKEYETQLIIAEEEYQIVSSHISHVICRYEVQTHTLHLPDNFANRYNLPKSSFLLDGITSYNKLISNISLSDFVKLFNDIRQGTKTGGTIIKMNELDGSNSWWDITFDTISDNDIPKLTVIICQDITEQREKDIAYIKWSQEIDSITKEKMYLLEWNLTQDVFEAERGEINDSILPYNGNISFNNLLQSHAINKVYLPDRPVFIHKTNREYLLEQYNKGTTSYNFEYRELLNDGTFRWVSLNIQLIPYPHTRDVKGYFLFRDVDGEKQETLDLKYRANKDALTGLLNRNSFIEKFINAMLENEVDKNINKYLLIIDIDNFKNVNDSHGHFIGDKFLVKIASILISLQKKGDYVGRLGGDEFLMLLKNETTPSKLIDTLNNIIKMLSVEIDGVTITCSIGVATFPDDGTTFDVLYEKADIALYKAKKSGRNKFCLIDSSILQTDKK